jgi:hypothetical protein
MTAKARGKRFCWFVFKLDKPPIFCVEQSQLLFLQGSLGRAGDNVPMNVRVRLLATE